LARQLSRGVVLVTGTNGKTATTKLLDGMLTTAGHSLVSNRGGSNLKQGLLSALISAASLSGVLRGNPTIGLFEVDEATVPLIVEAMAVTDVVVTNLFRDQLDRYGDLETVAATIGRGIQGIGAKIFLNADDPMVASLARYAADGRVVFFGIEAYASDVVPLKAAVDSAHCPECGMRLDFSLVFYSHLGHYVCRRCQFGRPSPSVAVSGVVSVGAHDSVFDVEVNGENLRAELPLGGLYNVYNSLAALAVSNGFGVPAQIAVDSLTEAQPAFGRMEEIVLEGRIFHLVLIKNPAGCTQVLESLLRRECDTTILIGINDLDADGRDVSWLWDVPFECLSDSGHRIVVTGIRAYDVGLRLHYGGIHSEIIESIPDALDNVRQEMGHGETCFLLTTYTAMYTARKHLLRGNTLKSLR
jgi:UDP-N-acetylmuramyl tripeptide synthase